MSARRSSLRQGVRTLGKGLVAYGVIGCVLAVVGVVIVFVLAGRLSSVGDRVTPQLTTISQTMDSTITALDNASTTSRTFAVTLQRTAPALGQVASSIESIEPQLASVGASLSSFNILGQQPLAQAGALFTQVAGVLATLGPQLQATASALSDNQAALLATAVSLDDLSASLTKAKSPLASGAVEQSIGELITIFMVALILIVVVLAVPAVAVLIFGMWLLRQVPARQVSVR